MITVNELMNQIAMTRQEIDSVEVKGVQNMAIMIGIYNRCIHLNEELQKMTDEIQNGRKEVGDTNGEFDSGSA